MYDYFKWIQTKASTNISACFVEVVNISACEAYIYDVGFKSQLPNRVLLKLQSKMLYVSHTNKKAYTEHINSENMSRVSNCVGRVKSLCIEETHWSPIGTAYKQETVVTYGRP